MRNTLHGLVCAFFLFVHVFAWGSSERDAAPLKPEAFGQCQFSFVETEHAKTREGAGKSSEYAYCSVHLLLPQGVTNEFAGLSIMGRGLHERYKIEHWSQDETDNGFFQDKDGRWQFRGTDLLLDSKMLKTSFSVEQSGNETLLVGHQLIKGNIAQGGPITLPGIRILRITPEFVVSVELNFQPLYYEKQTKGYKQLRESVSKELVEIVKSVQATLGIAGPTVRSMISP